MPDLKFFFKGELFQVLRLSHIQHSQLIFRLPEPAGNTPVAQDEFNMHVS